jgi:hypothetical protein
MGLQQVNPLLVQERSKINMPTGKTTLTASWNGLAPGISTLKTILSTLGQPEALESQEDAEVCVFAGGSVRIAFAHGATTARSILVRSNYGEGFPHTVADAQRLFGQLVPWPSDDPKNVLFAGRGVRVACAAGDELLPVAWFEIKELSSPRG